MSCIKKYEFEIITIPIFKYGILSFKETTQIHNSLKERAELLTKLFNSIEGIQCAPVNGALYAFAKVDIPIRAIVYSRVNISCF